MTLRNCLGLTLGTNSIGWAIVSRDSTGCKLIDQGVNIFKEGVTYDKGIERPSVQKRTAARASRRQNYRRRLRKIDLLKVLVEEDLCPPLQPDALAEWRAYKRYPIDADFINWQRTDDSSGSNPYHDRAKCLNDKLDLQKKPDRYTLGRALYHLAQRRGFLNDRKDATDIDDGKVKMGIRDLSKRMLEADCQYLGEYFYQLYQEGGKIRTTYADRNVHVKAEFDAICRRQELSEELRGKLSKAIFYQRPLKSQKELVGKCAFEPGRNRCQVSHPRYEEFRMWTFINKIRVKSFADEVYRPLIRSEISLVIPLFFRKTTDTFKFEDIAREIAGKGNYAFKNDSTEARYNFNFDKDYIVSGCPVTASIIAAFDTTYDDMMSVVSGAYLKGDGKSSDQILNDLWHSLVTFDSEEKLIEWLIKNFQLDRKATVSLARTRIPKGYASLSLKAIDKLTPHLKKGSRYEEAVLICNYKNVLNGTAENQAQHARLGSPRTSAIHNPMAMRTMFRLRILLNRLLKEEKIDLDTKINIEFASKLNDANMRAAIARYQRDLDKEYAGYVKELEDTYGSDLAQSTQSSDTGMLKYRLWKEQNGTCLYTGRPICVMEFIGGGDTYDIEHIVPRSRGGDDSPANKTLSENYFYRKTKRSRLPSELSNYHEIIERMKALRWFEKINTLRRDIEKQRKLSITADAKDTRDAAIQQRHYLQMKLDYWESKLTNFTMAEAPEGFTHGLCADVGSIGRYISQYLNSVFSEVHTIDSEMTSEFRKLWDLQEEYAKMEGIDHAHHCIDAITIACIGRNEYDRLAKYVVDEEMSLWGDSAMPIFDKPWPSFAQDVMSTVDRLMVYHHYPDNMPKQSRKVLKTRGVVRRSEGGKPLYLQGDTARGLLHQESFYGAIEKDGEVRYVIRRSLASIDERDIANIVDDVVRGKVLDAVLAKGLKKAVADGIWMNEEKRIPIRKVRLYARAVTSPVHLKRHRDVSDKEYKRNYHVVNDGNYCMAIYGTEKPSFKVVNRLESARFFNGKTNDSSIVPARDERGRSLRCLLKTGTLVLFYQDSPYEIDLKDPSDLSRRMYVVSGLNVQKVKRSSGRIDSYGSAVFRHHKEARKPSELTPKKGAWTNGVTCHPCISMLHTQFKALVQGCDFLIKEDGSIQLFLSEAELNQKNAYLCDRDMQQTLFDPVLPLWFDVD